MGHPEPITVEPCRELASQADRFLLGLLAGFWLIGSCLLLAALARPMGMTTRTSAMCLKSSMLCFALGMLIAAKYAGKTRAAWHFDSAGVERRPLRGKATSLRWEDVEAIQTRGEHAVLILGRDAKIRVPMSRLSEHDQEEVMNWIESSPRGRRSLASPGRDHPSDPGRPADVGLFNSLLPGALASAVIMSIVHAVSNILQYDKMGSRVLIPVWALITLLLGPILRSVHARK